MRPTRLAAALTLTLLAACTGTPPPTPGTATPPPATPSPATTGQATTGQATTGQATTEPPAAPTPAAPTPADAKRCTVPNVVGLIHQTAQDTMQAAGLYRLREEDATGQGRVLIVDRNWTTTAQSVEAGKEVPCDTVIVLSAKKTNE